MQKIQILCVQAHTQVFRYITSYGGNFLKRILCSTYSCSTKYNEIYICHLDAHKPHFYKNGINSINTLYAGSHTEEFPYITVNR